MDDPKALPTKAVKIVFFEDRAQVFRRVTLELEPGPHRFLLEGPSKVLQDSTLEVEVLHDGPASVTASKVQRTFAFQDHLRTEIPGLESPAALEERLVAMRRQLHVIQEQHQRLGTQLGRLDAIEAHLRAQLVQVPQAETCTVEDFHQAIVAIDTQRSGVLKKFDHVAHDLRQRQRQLSQATERFHEISTTQPVLISQVVVQLLVHEKGPLDLCLSYFTPCAMWRPAYTMRLEQGSDHQGRIHLHRFGVVWQATGEAWEGVQTAFSTSRPQQFGDPPALSEDLLYTRPKTDQERREIQVGAHEEEIALTSLPGLGPAHVHAMPGVDDGGEPQHFGALSPIDIPSTGRPVHVPLGDTVLPCTTTLLVVPEVSTVAHLRARITWQGPAPLLAGPCEVFRGQEAMGRTALGFVSQGESFEVSFGQDPDIQLGRRVERRDEDPKGLSRKQRILFTVHLHLKNLGQTEKHVRVLERVPISQIKHVQVELLKLPTRPDEFGHLEWDVALGPRHGETQKLRYAIESESKVKLNL